MRLFLLKSVYYNIPEMEVWGCSLGDSRLVTRSCCSQRRISQAPLLPCPCAPVRKYSIGGVLKHLLAMGWVGEQTHRIPKLHEAKESPVKVCTPELRWEALSTFSRKQPRMINSCKESPKLPASFPNFFGFQAGFSKLRSDFNYVGFTFHLGCLPNNCRWSSRPINQTPSMFLICDSRYRSICRVLVWLRHTTVTPQILKLCIVWEPRWRYCS